ncbi:MAG: pyruvate kinase [Firmicutes bacterium]|nr:pyruvate kinase [Bacillota bacterium]
MKTTKIVCSIGPVSQSAEMIEKLVGVGMSIARVNCSHGGDQNRINIETVKAVRKEKKLDIEIMLDTNGPDVRIGTFENVSVTLVKGNKFTLLAKECVGNEKQVFCGYEKLPMRVKKGEYILLGDGGIKLVIEEIKGDDIVCAIEEGGVLSDRKSLYVPNVDLGMPFMSDRDKQDVKMGLDTGCDSIAASFVGSVKDVKELRDFMKECGRVVPIYAKIESSEGIANLDEIMQNVEGVMVARGDLGVEYPLEKIPALQKLIIDVARKYNKFCIVATEMMETMKDNPRPTRAEVTDVANAVWQGADAVMLSAESAVGKHPILAVDFMRRITDEARRGL